MSERGRGVFGRDWHYAARSKSIPLAGPPTIIPRPASVTRVNWRILDGRAVCLRAAPDFMLGRARPVYVVLGAEEEAAQRQAIEAALKAGTPPCDGTA